MESKKLSVFLSILPSLVWSHQLGVLMRGENIPVLLKVCYSAANSIPKVLAVSVVIFVLLVDWLDLSGGDWSVMRWVMVLSSLPSLPLLLLDSIRCSGEPRHSHTLIRPPVSLMDHFFWLIINSLVNNIAPSSTIFHGPPLFFVKSWGVLHWTLGRGWTQQWWYFAIRVIFCLPSTSTPVPPVSPATSPSYLGPLSGPGWLGVTGATQLQLIGI